MTPTFVGGEAEDIISVLARFGNEPDFPQIFFGSKQDQRRRHWKNEPDDAEALGLALMALEKMS